MSRFLLSARNGAARCTTRAITALVGVASLTLAPPLVLAQTRAQTTTADYDRAAQLNDRFRGLLTGVADRPTWLDADRFWYRTSVTGGHQFVLVTVSTQTKRAPFDHAQLAGALNAATGDSATARTLPFSTFELRGADSLRVAVRGTPYGCLLTTYTCGRTRADSTTRSGADRPGGANPFLAHVLGPRAGTAWDALQRAHEQSDGTADDVPGEGPWHEHEDLMAHAEEVFAQRAASGYQRSTASAQHPTAALQPPVARAADSAAVRSPDGTQEVYIRDYNVWLRPVAVRDATPTVANGGTAARGGARAPERSTAGVPLTHDGSEGSAYVLGSERNRAVLWSPGGTHVVALRITPGFQRLVRYIESSPADQLQPKWNDRLYQKPGDVVTQREPVLINVATRQATRIDNALFPNAYAITALEWRKDSRAFSFEYNARGHQRYRVIEVDTLGTARTLVEEAPETFVSYRPASDNLSEPGARWRHDLSDGRSMLWMSERDGWKHLYHVDTRTGRTRAITKGPWVVRNVHAVDTAKQQIWFIGNGRDAEQDPYFTKFFRVNFDGSGLVAFTPEDGTHTVTWSPDSTYYVDQWQRPDLPAVTVLKRTSDQRTVMDLERGDASALTAAGYQTAMPFTAKGRDGQTDIWGVIVRPTNFDPSKRYPVIEQIYAGPQGSFAPKTFAAISATRTLAEHGFIVVQIDGMGTANRSKAFHDVAWQNLGDGGFPDRVLWHQAVAAAFPWYDASRVGIYGTSAGGQNALGALLFHPEFYHAAFSAVGCHDNRMDKIWWNEQWMGWPIGEHYARASNVDNAHKLEGKLMLLVGELDTNVDPASTMQVVNALVRAGKDFELVVLPGQGHTNGGAYGVRRMTDFFVRALHGAETPDRNQTEAN